MATVHFSLRHDFDASPEYVWRELIDWEGHAEWIPATRVAVHSHEPTAIGAEFTAWSGYKPLVLEDRMRVDALQWNDEGRNGYCRVHKLGPVLTGEASFTVEPSGSGSTMVWVEDVAVPYLPQLFAPIAARLGIAGFRLGMRRLAKLLAEEAQSAPVAVGANSAGG